MTVLTTTGVQNDFYYAGFNLDPLFQAYQAVADDYAVQGATDPDFVPGANLRDIGSNRCTLLRGIVDDPNKEYVLRDLSPIDIEFIVDAWKHFWREPVIGLLFPNPTRLQTDMIPDTLLGTQLPLQDSFFGPNAMPLDNYDTTAGTVTINGIGHPMAELVLYFKGLAAALAELEPGNENTVSTILYSVRDWVSRLSRIAGMASGDTPDLPVYHSSPQILAIREALNAIILDSSEINRRNVVVRTRLMSAADFTGRLIDSGDISSADRVFANMKQRLESLLQLTLSDLNRTAGITAQIIAAYHNQMMAIIRGLN